MRLTAAGKGTVVLSLATLGLQLCRGATYWVAPDGDDAADGATRETAWASPSRGTPARITVSYAAGSTVVEVSGTDGFLDSGAIRIGGESRAYTARTAGSFILSEGFTSGAAVNSRVYDAAILGGDGFDPGDAIQLAGGVYTNRPLCFFKSGLSTLPITYRSAPGERAVLLSTVFDLSPVQHHGRDQAARTEYITLQGLTVRNAADGNHGAPGMRLYGVNSLLVDDCDVDISGKDINGDNNAIHLYDAYGVVISNCILRSKSANGLAVMKASGILIKGSVVYECFNGISVHGASIPGHVDVEHCTFHHMNSYSAVRVEVPGTASLSNCIVTGSPGLESVALTGQGSGDYNCLWHNAIDYGETHGESWNGGAEPAGGPHDISVDPGFISLNPASSFFLRIPLDSPVAAAGEGGTHMGAFAPVLSPVPPVLADFNVQDYGAKGDGVSDDTPAIRLALDAAAAAGGGRVTFPATGQHYLITNTVAVHSDWVHLYGPGAVLKLSPDSGRLYHVVEVSGTGPTGRIVEDIVIDGLTLDATFSEPVGPLHPRGLWVAYANRVVARNLTITNTYCGMTFASGARYGEAIDVTVTDWSHDAFGASGWGINGDCTDIRFVRCRAVRTPACIKGWEIEDGAQRVYLEGCLIEDAGGTGTGYYVRHHEYTWPLLVDDVTFVRCAARNLSGAGFLITTTPGHDPADVRPRIRTRGVTLTDCETDGPVTIACGVESVSIDGGTFEDLMAVGFDSADPDREVGDRWPVRSLSIRDACVDTLKINANPGNGNDMLGDPVYPDYDPVIYLRCVSVPAGPTIVGPPSNVVIDACTGDGALLILAGRFAPNDGPGEVPVWMETLR